MQSPSSSPPHQICELTYEKQIDFSTVDLKKLKVKDLKKILSEWDEVGSALRISLLNILVIFSINLFCRLVTGV